MFATIARGDQPEALPLIRRFYNMGFNIEATPGTAAFLKENGIRTHVLHKIKDGSEEIPDAIRQGHLAYIINTRDIGSEKGVTDGVRIRQLATENNVTIFTSLDTVRVLLDVLEETTLTISVAYGPDRARRRCHRAGTVREHRLSRALPAAAYLRVRRGRGRPHAAL